MFGTVRLDRMMVLARRGPAAERLRRRIARDREHLFVFVTERTLRPSVIFRKVTNGFCSEWGAHIHAAFRSIVSTAKANQRSVLDLLQKALSAKAPSKGDLQPG